MIAKISIGQQIEAIGQAIRDQAKEASRSSVGQYQRSRLDAARATLELVAEHADDFRKLIEAKRGSKP
jgi:hypothetical protein